MRKEVQVLERLARLAEIRSDAELTRFSAFRQHVEVLNSQQVEHRGRLADLFAQSEPFSVEGARIDSQDAGRIAREISRLEAEMERIRPGFEAARSRAVREFGRVRALEQMTDRLRQAANKAARGRE